MVQVKPALDSRNFCILPLGSVGVQYGYNKLQLGVCVINWRICPGYIPAMPSVSGISSSSTENLIKEE